jgi:hypothetical protein
MTEALWTNESSDNILDSRDWRLGDIASSNLIVGQENHRVSVSVYLALMEGLDNAGEYPLDHERLELSAAFPESVN